MKRIFAMGIAVAAVTVIAANPPPSITVAYDASLSPGVTNYAVWWGPAPGVYTNHVDAGTNLMATIAPVARGATYYMAATCQDTNGLASDFSDEVVWTVPAPPLPPQQFRVTFTQ